ncbi:serine--tRNA ligase [Patescibacteria group bacterium]|nr:serine--tRNA ligase [Patescibacteria group bacterium]
MIKLIRENPDKFKKGIKAKGVDLDIDKLIDLDEKRRKLINRIEILKADKNKLGEKDRDKAKGLKDEIKALEPEFDKVDKEYNKLLNLVPNLPLDDVPAKSEIIKKHGEPKKLEKDYLSLAEKLDIIDVKRAAKVSGTRFGYLKGGAALLEFGLIQLALDVLKDFTPIIPPVMIKPESMKAMGYLDRGQDEIYYLQKDDMYLVGTSEQSIGPMHKNETINTPKRYLSFSTCFRREAGSYGKDNKGILRVHQFDKLEMFSFVNSEDSAKEHKYILSLQEKLMQLLKIPYQVVNIGADDLGDPAAAKFDIEAWMPGQGEYRETHSASNCTDFQARRLNIKSKNEFVHTLNGTAFAIGRTIIAIIENYQQKDGSIKVPKVLQKYIKIKSIK